MRSPNDSSPYTVEQNELRMAMIAAAYFWSGTSMVDGALAIMAQVRRTHPEQFKKKIAIKELCDG